MRLCRVCKVDKDSKRCTGCYMVWYCGQECQVGDWPAHKTDCKVTRDQYKQVLLVEQKTAVVNNITKKILKLKLRSDIFKFAFNLC